MNAHLQMKTMPRCRRKHIDCQVYFAPVNARLFKVVVLRSGVLLTVGSFSTSVYEFSFGECHARRMVFNSASSEGAFILRALVNGSSLPCKSRLPTVTRWHGCTSGVVNTVEH